MEKPFFYLFLFHLIELHLEKPYPRFSVFREFADFRPKVIRRLDRIANRSRRCLKTPFITVCKQFKLVPPLLPAARYARKRCFESFSLKSKTAKERQPSEKISCWIEPKSSFAAVNSQKEKTMCETSSAGAASRYDISEKSINYCSIGCFGPFATSGERIFISNHALAAEKNSRKLKYLSLS